MFISPVVLAAVDTDSARWTEIAGTVVDQLLQQNAYTFEDWLDMLRPARRWLTTDLSKAFRDAAHPERATLASDVLAVYAADQPSLLASLLPYATARQFERLFPHVVASPVEAASALRPELAGSATHPSSARQARAAIALLRLGVAERVWPLFRASPDPSLRTQLIHQLASYGVDPDVILQRLESETELSARSSLVLALGTYPSEKIPAKRRQRLAKDARDWHRTETDPGLHAASGWLLQQLGEPADLSRHARVLAPPSVPTGTRPHWLVNSQGQTLVVLPGPTEFLMGSPDDEAGREPNERQRSQRLPRAFGIGTTKVTLEQFLRFRPNFRYLRRTVSSPQTPVANVNWYDAVAYCRWLSEQEGVAEAEMCYPPLDQIGAQMKLPDDYLSRTGYRLPTEAEWEYACRSGTTTAYSFGRDATLLRHYGWFQENSKGTLHPSGQLMPNDFGLFDVHGNGHEWCDDWFAPHPVDGEQAGKGPTAERTKVIRSGSHTSQPVIVRSAHRRWESVGSLPTHYCSLRIARTCR